MRKSVPALFDEIADDQPYFFGVQANPIRESLPTLTYRFDRGTIGLSKGLLNLLGIDSNCYIGFVTIKKAIYIYRVQGQGRYWVNTSTRFKSGICSGTICKKQFVREAMRSVGNGPGEIISFPVAPFSTTATELGLDPSVYSVPFYRIVTDQKSLRE
ncbi:hypothetical protein GCM10028818_41190 [Spirosoma horti]